MELVDSGVLKYGRIKSEGKILEVTPILWQPDGSAMSLPPVSYKCPNWILGYDDHHYVGHPFQMIQNYRETIPGTSSNSGLMLSFMVRIYERSEGMVMESVPTIPEEWATMFAEAVKVKLA